MRKTIPSTYNRLVQVFLAGAAASALVLASYAYVVDRQIPESKVPSTYKAFLLQEVSEPKLIIDSGSNSHHGIDAGMISEALKINAINIADNAGYDIESKVKRIKAHAKKGDILLLPLEWSYYTRDRLTDDFVDTLFGPSRDYYNGLSSLNKTKLALSIPPKDVLERINEEPEVEEYRTMTPSQKLYLSALQSPHGSFAYDTARALQPGVAEQSCDQYAFGKTVGKSELKISKKMKRALAKLKKLNDNDITVLFAWPILVGEGCLTSSPEIQAFIDMVEAEISGLGMQILGRADDSVYPVSLRDDTPYHLISEGRSIHTKKLIELLAAKGIQGHEKIADLKGFATNRIDQIETGSIHSNILQPLPFEQKIPLTNVRSTKHLQFAAGWWPQDDFGYLMRSNKATIAFNVPSNVAPDAHLELSGFAIDRENYQMSASHNGVVLAQSKFSNTSPMLIPVKGLPRNETILIDLSLSTDTPARSPKQRGENNDERTVTLRLNAARLTTQRPIDNVPLVDPKISTDVVASIAPDKKAFKVKPGIVPKFDGRSVTALEPNVTLKPLPRNVFLSIGDPQIEQVLKFGKDWWQKEPAGRWMKTRTATIDFILPERSEKVEILRFLGDVFEGVSQTIEVFYKETLIARTVLQNGSPVNIPLEALPRMEEISLKIHLPDATVVSPFDLQLSDDPRELTGFLAAIELIQ